MVGFIKKTRKHRHLQQYPLACVGNMDETPPLWLDMPGETTVSRAGERTITIRTTGHDKGRFTVVLSAMADGRKLKPYVVFKGVRPIAELSKIPGVVVAYSKNGWMNEGLTKDWISRAWGLLNFRRRLLVRDAYRCHIMDSVSNHARRNANSDIGVIPGGLTGHLQPADISWNKPFIQGPVQRLDGVRREVLHASSQHACSRQGFMPQVGHRSLEQRDMRGDP